MRPAAARLRSTGNQRLDLSLSSNALNMLRNVDVRLAILYDRLGQ
jgi:hypothetical protein